MSYLSPLTWAIAIIVPLLVMVYLCRGLVWPWIKTMRKATSRRVEDCSQEEIEIPPAVELMMTQLETRGFERLGVSRTHLDQGEGVTWHMVNADRTIMVELVSYKEQAAVAFSSGSDEQFVIETSYPFGERFKHPNHIADWTRISMDAAYQIHLENLTQAQREYTVALGTIRSMNDVLEQERVYRAKFYANKLRPPMLRGLAIAVLLAVAISGAIIGIALTQVMLREADMTWEILRPSILLVIGIGGGSLLGFFAALGSLLHHAGA